MILGSGAEEHSCVTLNARLLWRFIGLDLLIKPVDFGILKLEDVLLELVIGL